MFGDKTKSRIWLVMGVLSPGAVADRIFYRHRYRSWDNRL